MGAQIKKEISIMKMINHHHVVSVKDVFATSAKIFIVLEFVGGGELFDKIANEGKLPEEKARFYFKQLVEGLSHCHNNGVCHRDLKPEVSEEKRIMLILSLFSVRLGISLIRTWFFLFNALFDMIELTLLLYLNNSTELAAGHGRQPEDQRLWVLDAEHWRRGRGRRGARGAAAHHLRHPELRRARGAGQGRIRRQAR